MIHWDSFGMSNKFHFPSQNKIKHRFFGEKVTQKYKFIRLCFWGWDSWIKYMIVAITKGTFICRVIFFGIMCQPNKCGIFYVFFLFFFAFFLRNTNCVTRQALNWQWFQMKWNFFLFSQWTKKKLLLFEETSISKIKLCNYDNKTRKNMFDIK